jgi:hypothetical protein
MPDACQVKNQIDAVARLAEINRSGHQILTLVADERFENLLSVGFQPQGQGGQRALPDGEQCGGDGSDLRVASGDDSVLRGDHDAGRAGRSPSRLVYSLLPSGGFAPNLMYMDPRLVCFREAEPPQLTKSS